MTKNGQYLREYIGALKNEIEIDRRAYELLREVPAQWGCLPRPAKWLSKNLNRKKVFSAVAVLLRTFWICGGGLLFIALESIRFLIHRSRIPKKSADVLIYEDYGLAFSSRAVDIIRPPAISDKLSVWITFPWAAVDKPEASVAYFDIFSFLTVKDFCQAFCLSLRSLYGICVDSDLCPWVLQSYTSFRWFLVRIGLEKLNNSHMYTAEHYDRWAVLADVLNFSRKGRGNSLSLVQHGLLKSLAHTTGFSTEEKQMSFPTRLKSIDTLYVYDEEAYLYFRNYVLSAELPGAPSVFYFKPRIELTPTPQNKGARILFVGHPMCEQLHLKIFEALRASGIFVAYYKGHPTAPMSEMAKQAGWSIVEGRQTFPEVDLLISYPSTLVEEYSNCQINSVVHPINLDIKEYRNVVERVQSELSKRR